MNQNQRGRTMPSLPPIPESYRPAPYVRHLLPTAKQNAVAYPGRGAGRYAPLATPVDTPSAAYTLTCDAGHCDAPTVAVVKAVEGCWLSMCTEHAAAELEVL